MSGQIWWCSVCDHAQTNRYGTICMRCGQASDDTVYPALVTRLARWKQIPEDQREPWLVERIAGLQSRITQYEETHGGGTTHAV